MEWNIAFMGAVGSGKTTAIAAVSDIDCLDTEVAHYEGGPGAKATTTVAMDMGVLELGQGDRLRLQGAPGQQRFDYMWDILLLQAQAVVVLVRAGPQAQQELDFYLAQVRRLTVEQGRAVPVVIGVTDVRNPPIDLSLQVAQTSCPCSDCHPPLLPVDARDRGSVVQLLQVVTALLEVTARHPEPALHRWLGSGAGSMRMQ